MKKIFLSIAIVTVLATGFAQADILLSWDFTGANSDSTWASTYNDVDVNATVIGRGAGAAPSTGNNSFRTTGFKNDGISLANTDYFEFTLTTTAAELSFTSIDMVFGGTATFAAEPGATNAWAYSLDGGSSFTMMPTFVKIGTGASSFDLSGESALQNITSTDTVTFRFYATGQTTTGGWGFTSTASGKDGLVINGTAVPEPSTYALLALSGLALVAPLLRRRS